MALLIAEFRQHRKEDFIREIAKDKLDSVRDICKIYDDVYRKVEVFYGVGSLAIIKIDKAKQKVTEEYKKDEKSYSQMK